MRRRPGAEASGPARASSSRRPLPLQFHSRTVPLAPFLLLAWDPPAQQLTCTKANNLPAQAALPGFYRGRGHLNKPQALLPL